MINDVRKLFPLLAVTTVAAASSPAEVAGQVVGTCWMCVESPFQPDNGSEICQGWFWGSEHCAQAGSPDFHLCFPYGDVCRTEVSAAADEIAVELIRGGQSLPLDGDHLILTEGNEIVVMRKCGAEIARFAVAGLKGADVRESDRVLAIGPPVRPRHPNRSAGIATSP